MEIKILPDILDDLAHGYRMQVYSNIWYWSEAGARISIDSSLVTLIDALIAESGISPDKNATKDGE